MKERQNRVRRVLTLVLALALVIPLSGPTVVMESGAVTQQEIDALKSDANQLNQQKKDGVGILFVGEDLDVMMALCDKILVLCHGKVMGVVHADKTTKEELGLMMTGALDLSHKYMDKPAGYARDTNITAEELEKLAQTKEQEEK